MSNIKQIIVNLNGKNTDLTVAFCCPLNINIFLALLVHLTFSKSVHFFAIRLLPIEFFQSVQVVLP